MSIKSFPVCDLCESPVGVSPVESYHTFLIDGKERHMCWGCRTILQKAFETGIFERYLLHTGQWHDMYNKMLEGADER